MCEILYLAHGGSPENVFRVPAGGFDAFYEREWHKLQDKSLIVADVFPTREWVWDDLRSRIAGAIVIDHHHSAKKFDEDKNRGIFIFREDACGSKLLMEYLCGEVIGDPTVEYLDQHEMVRMVDAHDRWTDVGEDVEEMALLMRSVGYDAFVERGVVSCLSDAEKLIVDIERRRLDEKMHKVIKNTELCGMNGVMCAVCILSEDQSHVLNAVLEAFPIAEVVFGVNPEDNCVSLRSRPGGVDCSKIAEQYGGGGHERAAGFVMKDPVTNIVMRKFVFGNP